MWFSTAEFLLRSLGVFNRCRQSRSSQWVQELEADKPKQVNLNCPQTPLHVISTARESSDTCCHRHHHCTRVQTQKGLTDRQLFLDSVCCGAVPVLVGVVGGRNKNECSSLDTRPDAQPPSQTHNTASHKNQVHRPTTTHPTRQPTNPKPKTNNFLTKN